MLDIPPQITEQPISTEGKSKHSYQVHNKWCYECGVLINACAPEAWGRLITAGDESSIVWTRRSILQYPTV